MMDPMVSQKYFCHKKYSSRRKKPTARNTIYVFLYRKQNWTNSAISIYQTKNGQDIQNNTDDWKCPNDLKSGVTVICIFHKDSYVSLEPWENSKRNISKGTHYFYLLLGYNPIQQRCWIINSCGIIMHNRNSRNVVECIEYLQVVTL